MCTKILYISEMDFDIKNGGAVASKEDLNILQKNYDVEKLIVPVTRRNFIRKILDLFTSQISTFYGRKTIKNIKKKIKNSGSDIIFFNNSIFGYLVKYASKLGKKTIVKFQNCEYILAKDCNRYWYIGVQRKCMYLDTTFLFQSTRGLC